MQNIFIQNIRTDESGNTTTDFSIEFSHGEHLWAILRREIFRFSAAGKLIKTIFIFLIIRRTLMWNFSARLKANHDLGNRERDV